MISVFDLFSIGIGPSSSHTVGPMRAAKLFVTALPKSFDNHSRIRVTLYGSLAFTGKGHGTDMAIFLGLEGETPESVDPEMIPGKLEAIRSKKRLNVFEKGQIIFDETTDLVFDKKNKLPMHPNGMLFELLDDNLNSLFQKIYYSVGGGFIVEEHESTLTTHKELIPFPFDNGAQLFTHCRKQNMTIADIMRANERSLRTDNEVSRDLHCIFDVMSSSIDRGCRTEGILPGGLNVRRRAPILLKGITIENSQNKPHPAELLEWVSLWALAVNEENAAGGRVVTAPTNGAAGVIPSVMRYAEKYIENKTEDWIETFLLTAGAIAILYKKGASISAAEMGCMGEVGVACSMAAGALTAVMGGSVSQIENAAEIGMEHNLGLTCDPVKGLVQIPCIERNTMGAIKAINAALLAIKGKGDHKVSLDQVIATMRETGRNMMSIYKETSLGGLAVNVPEC